MTNERFDALWTEIGERPGDPDGPDMVDIFDREVRIQPIDYDWILRAAVVRDAVTAFEVYLEKSEPNSAITGTLAQRSHQAGTRWVGTSTPN